MRCIECEYWVKRGYERGYECGNGRRECTKLTVELSNYSDGVIGCTTGDETEPFITTSEKFGCVLFEKRKEEKEGEKQNSVVRI